MVTSPPVSQHSVNTISYLVFSAFSPNPLQFHVVGDFLRSSKLSVDFLIFASCLYSLRHWSGSPNALFSKCRNLFLFYRWDISSYSSWGHLWDNRIYILVCAPDLGTELLRPYHFLIEKDSRSISCYNICLWPCPWLRTPKTLYIPKHCLFYGDDSGWASGHQKDQAMIRSMEFLSLSLTSGERG